MTCDPEPRLTKGARWVHAWALLTVCAVLPLLLLGAEVTTKKVGMVDPQGFRAPWHLLTVPLRDMGLGFLIEHSHRLAGFIVGTCSIILVASLWLWEPRRWVCWLGVLALVGVSAQGVLGILRVNLNALAGQELALAHGCFAQLVFALLVCLAVLTSRRWCIESSEPEQERDDLTLRRWSCLTVTLVFGQGILGAFVRHTDLPLGPRGHLLFAFVVVAALVWLAKLILQADPPQPHLLRAVCILGVLVVAQLFLGVESWLAKFASKEWHGLQPLVVHPEILRSFHYLVGSLIFAQTTVVALYAQRRAAWPVKSSVASLRRLEGAT